MASEFVLDPVSGIPDPPTDDSQVLEWAKMLTESLQKDHVANVDRTETMVMMNRGTHSRPESTGSRRFYHDSKSGILYLDTEISPDYSKWVGINETTTFKSDGRGVHVYLTTIPVASHSTGAAVSWEAEAWDEADYWAIGDPTEINIPETRYYQVVVEGTLTALTVDGTFDFTFVLNGDTVADPDAWHHIISEGNGEEYAIQLNYLGEFTVGDVIEFGYFNSESVSILDLAATVTPMTMETGGGGEGPGLTAHGDLSGLTAPADDHTQYLRNSDTGDSRATFATNWTDLTDGGNTTLHNHLFDDIYLINNGIIYWRNGTDDGWLEMITVNGSQLEIGNSGSDLRMDFDIGLLLGNDDLTITSGTSNDDQFTLEGGVIHIESYAGTVTIESWSGIHLLPGTGVIVNNNVSYEGKGSSGTARNLIKKGSSNETVIGESIAHDVQLLSTTMIDISGGARLRLPYAAPGSLANGDMWMESDGLHVYYGGSEHTLT